MIDTQISGFIAYCKISGFRDKSIESKSLRLDQFNSFIKKCRIKRLGSIQSTFAGLWPITNSPRCMSKRPESGYCANFTIT
jgi:hypothetical protein